MQARQGLYIVAHGDSRGENASHKIPVAPAGATSAPGRRGRESAQTLCRPLRGLAKPAGGTYIALYVCARARGCRTCGVGQTARVADMKDNVGAHPRRDTGGKKSETQPSPMGRGWPAAGAFTSRSGTGEGFFHSLKPQTRFNRRIRPSGERRSPLHSRGSGHICSFLHMCAKMPHF